MNIRTVSTSDVPRWISLSKEYDKYILQIVPNLTEWYEGNDTAISFNDYMTSKINKGEAFMAVDEKNNCCGIIAISRTNNRITFFGISHRCNPSLTGRCLLNYALQALDSSIDIEVNIIKNDAEQIQRVHGLFIEHGFVYLADGSENGVPVTCMIKKV